MLVIVTMATFNVIIKLIAEPELFLGEYTVF